MFLKELGEGDKKSIPGIKAVASNFLNSRYRAVTEDDFQKLAVEATVLDEVKVKRAIIYDHPDEGKVEIVIISDRQDKYITGSEEGKYEITLDPDVHDEYGQLVKTVKDYVEVRKLVGTVIKVKAPVYTQININVEIICKPHVIVETVIENVKGRIMRHLDPLVGGPNRNGWPYNRPLTIYELAHVIEETTGVERAENIKLGDEALVKKEINGLVRLEGLLVRVKRGEQGA